MVKRSRSDRERKAMFRNIKNPGSTSQHRIRKVYVDKTIKNREYIMGDVDHDGAKNIDDRKPYDPKDKSTVTDFSVAKDFEDIEKEAESHRKPLAKIENHYQDQGYETTSRVKSTYSAINKLKRKYLSEIADFGGMTIFVDSIPDAYKVGDDIEKNYDVVYYDDYYKNPQGGTWADYKALHYGVKVDEKIIEIQVKRKKDYEIAQKTHAEYKAGVVNTKKLSDKINLNRKPVGVGITKGTSDGCTYYDLVVKYQDGGTVSVDNYDSLSDAKYDKEILKKEIGV